MKALKSFFPSGPDFASISGIATVVTFVLGIVLAIIAIACLVGAIVYICKYVMKLLGNHPMEASEALGITKKLGLVLLGVTVGWVVCVGVFFQLYAAAQKAVGG